MVIWPDVTVAMLEKDASLVEVYRTTKDEREKQVKCAPRMSAVGQHNWHWLCEAKGAWRKKMISCLDECR